MKRTVIAFDFGASSGRAIKATYENEQLHYEEIHRFDNVPIYENGKMCHNYKMICEEIDKALEKAGQVDSIAFDTWGVDYGLIDNDGELIKSPVHYRDTRTQNIPEKVFEKISPDELYAETGNQIMPINTLFQLMAEGEIRADRLLFMPDLFAYYLCKKAVCEKTIASTSQMMNLKNGTWSKTVCEKCGIDTSLFAPICKSASIIGEKDGTKIIAAAGHDTQCAVAAMPKERTSSPAFLSCGTWSLIGCELDEPVLTEKSRKDELSNELGANGKINYLKNISGLWLIQETRRALKRIGQDYTYNDLEMLARQEQPFTCFIDPDDPAFAVEGDLPQRIRNYCKETNQPIPETTGAVIRCIYESLAMKYRFAIEQISDNTGKTFDTLHLLGGGTKDGFLCQMTADSLGFDVIAGPTEATAIGNIMLQLIALGDIKDIDTAREIIRKTEKVKTYKPANHEQWQKGYEKYCNILRRNTK